LIQELKEKRPLQSNATLQHFCESLAAKDAAGVARLFAGAGLLEFPFAGQRLVGRLEIENAVRRMCGELRSVSITVAKSRLRAGLTIAEGELRAVRAASSAELVVPIAMVVEEGEGGIARLSAYFDTYGQRLWVDGPVFAAG
jgi:hypothetical protein